MPVVVLAAIAHYGQARPVETPDTGTLRGDLLALLTTFSKARATFISVAFAAGFSSSDTAELRLAEVAYGAQLSLDGLHLLGDGVVVSSPGEYQGEQELAAVLVAQDPHARPAARVGGA
jgi:hypothetical protein